MIITYFGKQFFKIQQGELVIAINPISKESKNKTARFGADIVISTTNHPDYNGFEMVSHGDKVPFIINGPGDYEVKNIFIKGIQTEVTLSKKKYINTIYSLNVEGISICVLGALSSNYSQLPQGAREQIGSPDILFVPVCNDDLLNSSEAYKIGVTLDAGVIIPMEIENLSTDKNLKAFLKEGGQDNIKAIEKLTIRAKELSGREGEIIILENVNK